MADAVAEAYAEGALGANAFGSGKRIDMVLHRGAGRLHLRRRDRADELDRGQARQPADQAAVSGPGRACSACRPRSTTSRRSPRCRTSSPAAPPGTRASCLGNPKSTGTKLISVCGHVQRPGQLRDHARLPDEGPDLRSRGRHAAGPDAQGGDPGRLVGADHDRGRGRGLPDRLRGHRRARVHARLGRHDRHGRHAPTWCTRSGGWPASTPTSPAPSAPSAGRGRRGPPRCSSGSWRGRGSRTTSICCSISPRT